MEGLVAVARRLDHEFAPFLGDAFKHRRHLAAGCHQLLLFMRDRWR